MFRKIFFILCAFSFILGLSVQSIAQVSDSSVAQVSKSVNVGNKICPVLGENIDEKTKATYEYKGKIYNFCCSMCIDEFKKDPEKYIKKVEEELNTKATDKSEIVPEHSMSMHEGHQH